MCKTYELLLKESRYFRLAFKMLDEMLRLAERAHPALPTSVRDVICSGLGRLPMWYKLYYLPITIAEAIESKHFKGKDEQAKLFMGWAAFLWSPTCNREEFESWKKKLEKFESLEEIVKYLSEVGDE